MYIKAKYPTIGNDYVSRQGFGSLYGGNQTSVVDNNNQERELEFVHEPGETFTSRAFSRDFSSDFNSYNLIK